VGALAGTLVRAGARPYLGARLDGVARRRRRGFDAVLVWARSLGGERVWALEDCRHVSGSLERFLIERGERVVRIPTHLTAKARKSARRRGKSDPIDALNVARAALQQGLDTFLAAQLDGPQVTKFSTTVWRPAFSSTGLGASMNNGAGGSGSS
jgi:transposase